MPTRKSPRKGSLQFWPRKRAKKFLPSINWTHLHSKSDKKLLGFICYKAGMTSAHLTDNTPDSMTKGKKISIPATILECPLIKTFSVRFYKNNKPISEILSSNIDKELKKKLKLPKEYKKTLDSIKPEEYDDIRAIIYSIVKKTKIKKTPDLIEVALSGTKEEKLAWVKENLGKEISLLDYIENGELVDLHGLTKGKGFQGPVKRFGITLKVTKSEKGRRTPGSIAPWHPARITFRSPMPGQLGMFTRVIYNNKILSIGKAEDLKNLTNIKNYGDVKADYIIVKGSVQGPSKRQLVITPPARPTKRQLKLNYDFLGID